MGAIYTPGKGTTAAGVVTSTEIDADHQALDVTVTGALPPLPLPLGQEPMASSIPVVIASDQTPIPVTGFIVVADPSVGPNGAAAPAFSTQAGGVDDATGNLEPIRIYDLSGAGEFAQGVVLRASSGGGSVETGTAANPLRIDPTGTTTQPISAAALPLPTGAATEVTLASIDATLDVALSTRASEATLATRASEATLSSIDGKLNSLGQKLMAGSVPVAIASDQSAVPISAAALPLPAGAATSALQVTGNASLASIDADIDVALSTRASEATLATRAAAATQTDGTQRTMINNGATVAAVKAAATAAVAADPALVVAISPNNSVAITVGTKDTFSAAINNLLVAAAATDIFTISGSATRTVKVTRIELSGMQTVTGHELIQLVKRSTADTLGTSTNPTVVPHDSGSAAGTAVVTAYTVNPTLGATVGTVRTGRFSIPSAAAVASGAPALWTFGDRPNAKPIQLNGVAQQLAINLNGVAIGGGSLSIDVEWTEE